VSEPYPSFFARFFMAFGVFFRTIFDGAFAAGVRRAALSADQPARTGSESELEAAELPKPSQAPTPAPAPRLLSHDGGAALQLLALLQREGRLVDFLQEDVSAYSDADIGAAARVVHDDCKRALDGCIELVPVRSESEGHSVTLPVGFTAGEVRLTGNVVGEPPFSGTLTHRGWRAASIELPKVTEGHDVHVILPAEVKL
jgi:hypothetical protein